MALWRLITFALFATSLSAATLCVKPSSAGAATGADWSNPLGSSFTPVRGNTYYIAAGTYGSKIWSVANSGTTLITIKMATTNDHATATGWTDSMAATNALWTSWEVWTDYWMFDGQWRSSGSDWDGANIQYGFKVKSSGPIRLDDGSGNGCDNSTFRYIDAVGSGQGSGSGDDIIYGLTGNTGITFQYCSLRDSDRTIFLWRGTWTSAVIEYCFLARNNSTPAVHGEMLSCTSINGAIFRYNIIENTEGTAFGWAVLNGSGSKSSANTATGLQIYGNILRSVSGADTAAAIIYVANDGSNLNYVDNLSYHNNTHVNCLIDVALIYSDVAGTNNAVSNNVFYNSGAAGGGYSNPGTLSYNWYWNTANSGDSGTGKTVCLSSCSALFVSVPTDMHLASALAGTSLGASYQTDFDGVTRGADGTWDRGAFEYSAGGGGTSGDPHQRRPALRGIRLRP